MELRGEGGTVRIRRLGPWLLTLGSMCACATTPILNDNKTPNRGSATNRVDILLQMKNGTCHFEAYPKSVAGNKKLKDKIKWDVTNYCDKSAKVEIYFSDLASLFESGCTLATGNLGTNGGHDDIACKLLDSASKGPHPYTVKLNGTQLAEDPDVEVWD
jgi:hypothetical protein